MTLQEKAEAYQEPKFGSLKWLEVQAGYQRFKKVYEEDESIRLAVKDLLLTSVKEALENPG